MFSCVSMFGLNWNTNCFLRWDLFKSIDAASKKLIADCCFLVNFKKGKLVVLGVVVVVVVVELELEELVLVVVVVIVEVVVVFSFLISDCLLFCSCCCIFSYS